MHAERDALRDKVFPALEEALRSQRRFLEPIDLRWGVETRSLAEEEQKEELVLKVCLREIERSRPYMIILLGDRYGSIASSDRIRSVIAEHGFHTALGGKSITALEIEFGLSVEPDRRKRTFCYLRNPLPYHHMPPETAAKYSDALDSSPSVKARYENLESLKDRLPSLMPGRIRHYSAVWDSDEQKVTGLEEFVALVCADLEQAFEDDVKTYGLYVPETWTDVEKFALEEFVELKERDFVGREGITEHLLEFATLPDTSYFADQIKIVTAFPGGGKSALFAHVASKLAKKPDLFVLRHAAGIGSPYATSTPRMLLRFIQELARFLGEQDPTADFESQLEGSAPRTDPATGLLKHDVADTQKSLESLFGEYLTRAARKRRVVVLIDAVDEFEETPAARHLTWLSAFWPENVRLIAFGVPGPWSHALGTRPGADSVELSGLKSAEAEELVSTVCARLHKTLDPEILHSLTTKENGDGRPAAANPLWLTLAIEQLLLLDEDDFLRAELDFQGTAKEKLHQLMWQVTAELPGHAESICEYMLTHTERVFGVRAAITFVNAIALSRHGLRESDLKCLLSRPSTEPFSDLEFAQLRRGFRAHLVQRGVHGQWDFAHNVMRSAVLKRNLAKPARMKRWHTRLAKHFLGQAEGDPFRQSELMAHFIASDAKLDAARHYAASDLDDGERIGAERAMVDHILSFADQDSNPGLEWVCSLPEQEGLRPAEITSVCTRLSGSLLDTLQRQGTTPMVLAIAETALQTIARLCPAGTEDVSQLMTLAVCQHNVGQVLLAQGQPQKALSALSGSLTLLAKIREQIPNGIGLWGSAIASAHNAVGDAYRGLGMPDNALTAYEASADVRRRLVRTARRAELLYGLASTLQRIGDIRVVRGESDAAITAFTECLQIHQELVCKAPDLLMQLGGVRNRLAILVRFAQLYSKVGRHDEARRMGEQALEAAEELQRQDLEDPYRLDDLSSVCATLGDIYLAQGALEKAERAYQRGYQAIRNAVRQDPTNARWAMVLVRNLECLSDARLEKGDRLQAMAANRECADVAQLMLQRGAKSLEWMWVLSTCYRMEGNILAEEGKNAEAMAAYERAVAACAMLNHLGGGSEHYRHGLAVLHLKIGELHRQERNHKRALTEYTRCLAILEDLVKDEPSKPEVTQNLAICLMRVGEVQSLQNDVASAIDAYERCVRVAQQTAQLSPDDPLAHRNVAAFSYAVAKRLWALARPNEAARYWILVQDTVRDMVSRQMPFDAELGRILKEATKLIQHHK